MQRLRQPIYLFLLAAFFMLLIVGASISSTELLEPMGPAEIIAAAPLNPNHGLIADPATKIVYIAPRVIPGRASQPSTINVNWNPSSCGGTTAEWTTEAQEAFAYAIDIWESLIVSTVPIEVDACWRVLGNNVLGSAGANQIGRNFAGAPLADTWYPISTLNSLTGHDADPAGAEITANFNSSFSNWYFGTDGNPGFSQYDFVSVVLHEVGHGLGFAGSMAVSSDVGVFGYGSNGNYDPMVYDTFAENGSGTTLITGFPYGSTSLASQLTGGNLYFDGASVQAANDGNPVKIYSPSSWSQGSSFSHLDTTFDNTDHALMTHSIANGEAIHDPGNLALAILKDVGWELSENANSSPTPQPTSTPQPTETPSPSPYPNPDQPPETDDEYPYIDTIDNEQDKTDAGYPLNGENFRWQKFVPNQSVMVAVEFWLEVEGAASDLTVEISDLNDDVLASTVLPASQVVNGWNRVTFNSPIDVIPGVAYQLSVGYSTSQRTPDATIEWSGGQAEVYCVACSSDVNDRNYEFSYAFRSIMRIFLTESIYLPLGVSPE